MPLFPALTALASHCSGTWLPIQPQAESPESSKGAPGEPRYMAARELNPSSRNVTCFHLFNKDRGHAKSMEFMEKNKINLQERGIYKAKSSMLYHENAQCVLHL